MKKTVLTLSLVLMTSLPAMAFFNDGGTQNDATGQNTQYFGNGQGSQNGSGGSGNYGNHGQNNSNFQQRKEELLSRVNSRIARLQGFATCVKSAENHQALGECMDQFRPERKEKR